MESPRVVGPGAEVTRWHDIGVPVEGEDRVGRAPAAGDVAVAVQHAATGRSKLAGHVEGFPDTFRGLFSQVYRDVANGSPSAQPAYPTFAAGHEVMLVSEAIARSHKEQKWMTIER